MPTETVAPDADSAAGGWTTNTGGGTNLFASIDESTASDTDYIRSPTRSAASADLVVRLKQGATTIATWTHNAIGTSYVDAVQTLTAPQLAAITDFNNLLIELDDNGGAVYRATLANPTGALTTPVTVSYRYKAETVSATYTGPGDIVSGWSMWWGLRAFTAASIGGNLVKLRRDNDNAVQDFVSLANGSLDVAAITTFKGANNLFVDTLYDQTGNGKHVTAAGGDQPPFTLASLGSLPTIGATSGAHTMNVAGTVTQAQPFTMSSVAHYDGTAGRKIILGEVAALVLTGRRGTDAIMDAGAEVATAISTGWHSVIDTFNGASSQKMIDGSGTATAVGTNGFSASTVIFYYTWTDLLTEVGMRAGTLSAGDKTALDANQQTYWGI